MTFMKMIKANLGPPTFTDVPTPLHARDDLVIQAIHHLQTAIPYNMEKIKTRFGM